MIILGVLFRLRFYSETYKQVIPLVKGKIKPFSKSYVIFKEENWFSINFLFECFLVKYIIFKKN